MFGLALIRLTRKHDVFFLISQTTPETSQKEKDNNAIRLIFQSHWIKVLNWLT